VIRSAERDIAGRAVHQVMRILHWGTFDMGKPRARILRAGIRATGAALEDCHRDVWTGLEDKTQTSVPRLVGRMLRWLLSYPALLWRFLRAPPPDLVLISFPGLLDTIVLAPFARLRRVPVAWDMFISAYDTLVFDRGLTDPRTPLARCLRWLEGFAIRRADVVFLDTEAHARRVESLFRRPLGSLGAVWVGAEVECFPPSLAGRVPRPFEPFQVLFYGHFIPLHGVPTIVEAARLMRDEAVEWTLIGRGQQGEQVQNMLSDTPLPKLRWIDRVDYTELGSWIGRADLCLGIFGTSEKAASVIPNKVFQIVAVGRPVVTRDSAAIRELLGHLPPCVYLVPAGDPHALAAAVRAHMREVGRGPAPPCHRTLPDRISAPAIGRQFTELVIPRMPHRNP